MAIFPQGLTNVDARCNPGERRVLAQLKRCLGDDHLVWHDVPIGPRARQPDFVVLSPRWGILLLEVKAWKRATFLGGTPDAVRIATAGGAATVPHPLRQARDVTLELVDLMKADPALVHGPGAFAGRLLFPYGFGAVMSHLSAKEVAGTDFEALFPPARVLLRDDLDPELDPMRFRERLSGMFTISYPHTLSLPQRDRIRWHLFPEVRLPQQATLDFEGTGAGGDPPALPDLLHVMDLEQEQVARTLGVGHRVIHGPAGSGKTMILVFRAQQLAAATTPEQPILVLCFNRALGGRIEAVLRARGIDERVQVRTFHAWCRDMVQSYALEPPQGVAGDAYFQALAGTLVQAVERGRVPGGQYLSVLIDEAHDFEDAWLAIAAKMVSPRTNSLLVLYDDAQSIYHRPGRPRRTSFASLSIEARGRTSILRLNYRNTAEVLALAMACAERLLDEAGAGGDGDEPPRLHPASAGRRGPLPVLIEAADPRAEAEEVAARVQAAIGAGASPDEIVLLLRTKAAMRPFERALAARRIAFQSMNDVAFRRFDWARPAVRLVTLHSAKGLEFARVFVAALNLMPHPAESIDEATRLLYVAMTRATHELVLSAHGDSPMVQRVRMGLVQAAGSFGG
jgi:hypothetical protein